MVNNGVGRRLRLIAIAAVMVLSGCVDTQNTIASADGLTQQLQTFVTDTARHLFAAWLF